MNWRSKILFSINISCMHAIYTVKTVTNVTLNNSAYGFILLFNVLNKPYMWTCHQQVTALYLVCLIHTSIPVSNDALLSDVLLFLNICWILLLIQSLDVTITVAEEMAWYLIEYWYSPIIHSCSDLKAHNPVSSSVIWGIFWLSWTPFQRQNNEHSPRMSPHSSTLGLLGFLKIRNSKFLPYK